MVTVRADESDEYHETQLREKPEDASAHSNYGVFLKDKKGNLQSAERKYRKAIDRDGNHVDTLGNLANFLGRKRTEIRRPVCIAGSCRRVRGTRP